MNNKNDVKCEHGSSRFEHGLNNMELSLTTKMTLNVTWTNLEMNGFEVCNDCNKIIGDVILDIELDDDKFIIIKRDENEITPF